MPDIAPAVVQGLSKKSLAQEITPNKHECLPNLIEDSSESCCSSTSMEDTHSCTPQQEAQTSSWEYDSPSVSRRSSNSSSSSSRYCEFPSIPNAMEDVSTVTPSRSNTPRQDTAEADAIKGTASTAAATTTAEAITPSPKKIPRALLELASFNDMGNENCEPTRRKRMGKSNHQFGFSNLRPIPSNYAFLFEECNSDVRKLVRKYGTTNETKNKRGRRKQLWKWED